MKTAKTPSSTTTITDATLETKVAPTMLISVMTTTTSDANTLSQPLHGLSPKNSETA